MNNPKLPSDFSTHPWNSVINKIEYEVVARNVMTILERTQNKFRVLTWTEYKKERLKDGNFSETEKGYFKRVIPYCSSPEFARDFCPSWSEVI